MNLITKLRSLYHKPGVNSNDWNKVSPKLLVIADYVLSHCDTHNLPVVITSIIRPRIPGVSVSDTHSEGRAFDISVHGWSDEDIRFMVESINASLTIGAVSMKDKVEREAVYEDGILRGTGPHIHFQVRR